MSVYTLHMCKENTCYLLDPTKTSSVWEMQLGMLFLEIINSSKGNKAF